MLKLAMIGLLGGASLMAQTAAPSGSPAASPSASPTASPSAGATGTGSAAKPAATPGTTQGPGTAAKPQASPAPKPGQQAGEANKESAAEAAMPPTAAVITIHGVCGEHKPAATGAAKAAATRSGATKTGAAKTGGANEPCATKITKAEFDKLLNMVVPPGQPQQPGLRRNLAQRYVELLAIANAAEKAGVEKSPEYALLRLRALTEAYQRELDEKYRNPPPAEVEAYYKEHQGDFESITLRRVYVPKNDVSGKGTPEEKAAFTRKASTLADELRDRATKGEDLETLQKEAYSKLGLTAAPPNTQVGLVRKGALPPATENQLFSLNAGGVTKIDEPTGFVIYKVEKKEALPMDKVKDEIARMLHRQKMEARLKEITSGVKADYNDTYFGPPTPPVPQPPGEKH